MNVLILGANGFMGNALSEKILATTDWHVYGMDLSTNKIQGLLPNPRFHFVEGEQQAAELDADSEDDVLASTRAFDLQTLAEDELLLALPLVPRHAVCPQPLLPEGAAAADEASLAEPESAHPFSVLAALKRGPH